MAPVLSFWHRTAPWTGALVVATSIHGVLAWGLVSSTQRVETPPRLASGFEVVELPSSSAAKKSEPVIEPVVEEQPKPEPEPEPEPLVQTIPEPKPLPPVKPKPPPKPMPPPEPKPQPKPQTEAKRVRPSPLRDADALRTATAYVAPSQHAVYLKNPKPAYPLQARQRGMEGRVVLRTLVGADGAVKRVEVDTSSGYALLDRASRTAVLRWRFVPATRGGVAVEGEVLIPFDFKLTSG